MKIIVQTHTGRREHNEDVVRELKSPHYKGVLVSDGMGGALAGEVASAMVADGMAAAFPKLPKGDPVPALLDAIRQANRDVFEASKKDADKAGMGATLVMALTDGKSYWVLHVGDSRCYRLKDNEIEQVTRDHSAVQDSIDRGVMTEEEAKKTPWKNALLQCMGGEEGPAPGVTGPEPFVPGTVLLLCSDGLSGFVSEMEILDGVAGTRSGRDAAEYLIRRAWHNGSDDNISVCLMEQGRFQRSRKPLKPLPSIVKQKQNKSRRSLLVGVLITAILLLAGLLAGAAWWWAEQAEQSESSVSVETAPPAIKTEPAAPDAIPCWTSEKVSFAYPFTEKDRLTWVRKGYDTAVFILYRGATEEKVSSVPVGRTILLKKVTRGKQLEGFFTCVLQFSDKRESEGLPIIIRKQSKKARQINNGIAKGVLFASRPASGVEITGTERTYYLPLTEKDVICWTRPGSKTAKLVLDDPYEYRRGTIKIGRSVPISRLVGEKPTCGKYKVLLIFRDGTHAERWFSIRRPAQPPLGQEPETNSLNKAEKKPPVISLQKPVAEKPLLKTEPPGKQESTPDSGENPITKSPLPLSRPGESVFKLPLTRGYTLKVPEHRFDERMMMRVRREGEEWGPKRFVGREINLLDLLGADPKPGRYEYQLWYQGQKPGTAKTFLLQPSKGGAR